MEIQENRAVLVHGLWWLDLNFGFSFSGLPARRRIIMLRLRDVSRMTAGFGSLHVKMFHQDEREILSSPIHLPNCAHDSMLCVLGELTGSEASSFCGYINVSHRDHYIGTMTFSDIYVVDAQIHLDTVGFLPSFQKKRIVTLLLCIRRLRMKLPKDLIQLLLQYDIDMLEVLETTL